MDHPISVSALIYVERACSHSSVTRTTPLSDHSLLVTPAAIAEDPQGSMDTHEIVVHEWIAQGMRVVFCFFEKPLQTDPLLGRQSRTGGEQPIPAPMSAALAEAEAAAAAGEVPVGAVLVDAEGRTIAAAGNRVEADRDPTAHAEMLALRAGAASLGAKRLETCDLYVTLEPCPMCAAAIAFARIRRLYFAAYDPKGGGVEHGPRIFDQPTCNHRPELYGGIGERKAAALLRRFFRARR